MKTSIMSWDFRSPSATVAFGGHIEMKLVLYSGQILQFPRLLLCLCIHLQLDFICVGEGEGREEVGRGGRWVSGERWMRERRWVWGGRRCERREIFLYCLHVSRYH